MILTKLHIFLIILTALILCSCLGMCSPSTKEGYTSSNYNNYADYYSNLNDANISATDWSQGLDAQNNNPYYNKNDEFHKKYDDRNYNERYSDDRYSDDRYYDDRYYDDRYYDDRYSNRKHDYSYKDDLNGGDKNDSSTYMISTSYKKNKKYNNYDDDNNNDDNPRRRRNDIFSSVSSGAVNGSIFSNTNNNDDNNGDNNNGVMRDQIPNGQEDMYILKSQALTPICPACPPPPKVDCDQKCGKAKCPPCPPCARCPEPQFDCMKVPNYNTTNLNQNLPIPWMAKL